MNTNSQISMENRASYSITELAGEFNITSRTIRFYEDKGLINPDREGTVRIYSRSDRARLKIILRGRRLGFSLQDIKKMMDLYSPEGEATGQLTFTLEKCQEQLAKLVEQRRDIDEAITELEDGIEQLQDHLASGAETGKKFKKTIA
ncbi:MerR family DNA-binding transcriptional regulator [Sneathiella sp.]|uniref:MerR family transcriptional regulator n=1 Tax=Sneathiella sp. TaxID=1964365 RepID=UPI003566EC5D